PRIFTGNSISLSWCWRQWGSRYAFRAGRNLPDKEFRYLRTVIVTAAVYRGFDSTLSHLLLTFRHRAGVRPYTSSLDFAESCVFSKQSPPPALPPIRTCVRIGPSSSEVTRANCLVPSAHFSQAPQHTLLVHLCRFGVRSIRGSYFLGLLRGPGNPISPNNLRNPSLPAGPGMLTWFPSATPFGLALGAG